MIKGVRKHRSLLIYCAVTFVILSLFSLLSFLLLRYSNFAPFAFVRAQLVATAMTTYSHQYIARIVATESEIEAIMDDVLRGFGELDAKSAIQYIEIAEELGCTEGFTQLEYGVYAREISGFGFVGKLMLILDPSRVIIGTADVLGEQPATVKSMVESHGAIAGINGGWFSGYSPTGFVITGGQRVYPVYPLAEYYPSDNIMVGFTWENILVMGLFTEQEAHAMGIRDSLSTYPVLILNGEPQITVGDGGWGIAPRTAIAQREDGAILFLAIDGRQWHSMGATLRQVQDALLENNAHNAMALDGGSSTAMYHRGVYLNSPALGFERSVPTSFLVKPVD